MKNMSKADKFFAELGYNKSEGFDCAIYTDNLGHAIEIFRENDGEIKFRKVNGKEGMRASLVTMQELKAINKKCEELGWNE